MLEDLVFPSSVLWYIQGRKEEREFPQPSGGWGWPVSSTPRCFTAMPVLEVKEKFQCEQWSQDWLCQVVPNMHGGTCPL